MPHENFNKFIEEHRDRFDNNHNNLFAFAFGQAMRYYEFLEIIHERYLSSTARYIANTKAMQANTPRGTHPISPELASIQKAGYGLSVIVHLEIESYYVFAKILLDKLARAIEFYFGPVRKLPLDSHDDLTKHITGYSHAKSLELPPPLHSIIKQLKEDISDYRDYEISHQKSPRALKATVFSLVDDTARISTMMYTPKDSDKQVDSKHPPELLIQLNRYIDCIIEFILHNQNKTVLRLETK